MKRDLHKTRKFIFRLLGFQNNYYQSFYYKRIFSQYNDLNSYLSLHQKCNTNSLKTTVEICYSNFLRFGSTIQDVKKTLYNTDYYIHNNKALNIKIVFYRFLIGNEKVKCKMHFFEDKLFFYNYTFSHSKKDEGDAVIDMIKEKYQLSFDKMENQSITDNYNNCLQINNDLELTINYLSLNCDFFNDVESLSLIKNMRLGKQNHLQLANLYARI